MHRSADEKSGVKIIHRKSSVGWVAKVESRTPSMSGFVLSKLLALGHRGEGGGYVCTVCKWLSWYNNMIVREGNFHWSLCIPLLRLPYSWTFIFTCICSPWTTMLCKRLAWRCNDKCCFYYKIPKHTPQKNMANNAAARYIRRGYTWKYILGLSLLNYNVKI